MQCRTLINMLHAAFYDDEYLLKSGKHPEKLRELFNTVYPNKSVVTHIRFDEILFDSASEYFHNGQFYRIFHSVMLYKNKLVVKTFHKHFDPFTFTEYENDGLPYKNMDLINVRYLNVFEFLRLYQANIIDLKNLFGEQVIYQILETKLAMLIETKS